MWHMLSDHHKASLGRLISFAMIVSWLAMAIVHFIRQGAISDIPMGVSTTALAFYLSNKAGAYMEKRLSAQSDK